MKNAVKQVTEKKEYGDNRFWKLKTDAEKTGSAVIRFLPDKDNVPYVQYFSHWFRYEGGSGEKVYADKCPTTIGGDCVVCSKNRELWNSSFDVDKDVARTRKRKTNFVANIYVIKDPAQPENEGKVFLYNFGTQVSNLYNEAMMGGEDADELDDGTASFIPCIPAKTIDEDGNDQCGADFILRATKKKGSDWQTYEKSKFKSQSEFLGGDEAKIDEIIEKTHSLAEWKDAKNYPDQTKVANELAPILGTPKVQVTSTPAEEVVDDADEDDIPNSTGEMSDEDYVASLV